jgi:hypothetical protein
MDVLVLGPQGPDVDEATQALTDAGHAVRRCVTPESLALSPAGCVGAVDHGDCPFAGPVDVALMVGAGVSAEGLAPVGLGCAARHNVPITTLAADEQVVASCEAALRSRDEEWTDRLRVLLRRDDVTCRTTRHLGGLHLAIEADLPADDPTAPGRLAARAYDVVRNEIPGGLTSLDVSVVGAGGGESGN